MKLDVMTLDNQKIEEIELKEDVFSLPVRRDILARIVRWQLAKLQTGNHKVKRRSEISASHKKPFKQKGTGNARQGFKGVTQFRGGATVHGPVVRSHAHSLTKKFRQLGLKTALSSKYADDDLVILDKVELSEAKTKDLKNILSNFGWKSALIVDGDSVNTNVQLASRNIHGLDVLPQVGINVYDILKHEKLVLTKEAVSKLVERL